MMMKKQLSILAFCAFALALAANTAPPQ